MLKLLIKFFLINVFAINIAYGISLQAVGIDNTKDTLAEKELKKELGQRIFGANLFTGTVTAETKTSISSSYVISIGDQITFNTWGALVSQSTLTVDNNGNIFIPEVGPVRVADLRLSELETRVKQQVGQTYKDNVKIYVNLVTSNPVNIFVTGFVNKPGQFSGEQTDSIINFIHKAEGIDLSRGSYRNIKIINGSTGASKKVDLYPFLLEGKLPEILLHDNDTIVVEPRKGIIQVDGKTQNDYLFEIKGNSISGQELIELTKPSKNASHASIAGVRNGESYYVYITVEELAQKALFSGDKVEFKSDIQSQVIDVTISGENLGPAQFAVKKGTKLFDILAKVPVDKNTAQLGQIFIKRESVAKTQKEIIIASLEQLQRKILSSSSLTAREEQAKAKKLQEIKGFLEKANEIKPLGIVVISKTDKVQDIILEQGDEIVIPTKTDIINIGGEVHVPQAMVYNSQYTLEDYIDSAGGYAEAADEDNILIIHPNGDVSNAENTTLYPGVKIIVLPEIPTNYLRFTLDITRILFNLAIATRNVFLIFDEN